MKNAMRAPVWLIVGLLCLMIMAGCGGSGGNGDDNGGEVVPPPTSACTNQIVEQEPNDNVSEAQILGEIRPGDCFAISGNVSVNSGEEADLDGYRILVVGDQTLEFTLTHSNQDDFDLILFDATVGEILLVCEETTTPEICSLPLQVLATAAPPLGIVIRPFEGRGDYILEIVSSSLPAENNAPIAEAGPDRAVTAGTLVTLDGRGSSDPDGDLLTFQWSFTSIPPGSTAILSDPMTVNPTFTADVEGPYVVSLVVNDGMVDSVPDTVTITTLPQGTPLACDMPFSDTIDDPMDTGLFSFSVTEGDIVAISVTEDTGLSFAAEWRLLDSRGEPAPACDRFSTVAQRDCGPLPATGNPYRIEVRDQFQDGTGSYSIHLQRLPAATACENTPLTCDVPRTDTIDDPLDTDLLSFSVTEGDIVAISVTEDTGLSFAAEWRLLDSRGNLALPCDRFSTAAQRDCGPLAAAGNPYRIEVRDQFQDGTGTYSIDLQHLPAATACEDTPLTCDLPRTDTIDDPLDTDLLSFSVAEDETVTINIAEDTGLSFAAEWRLLDGRGNSASPCDRFSTAAQRDCGPLAVAGNPYRIEVRDQFQDGTGTYSTVVSCGR